MSTGVAMPTSLVISLKGEVVESNFSEFCEQLKSAIKGLNRELSTDQDFEAADESAKFLKEAEKSLKDAKAHALEQAEDIQRLFAAIEDVSAEARQARLDLEKQVKARKAERRQKIIDAAVGAVVAKKAEAYRSRIDGALKGRKAFERMEWAAENEAAVINAEVKAARAVIEPFEALHGAALLPDLDRLEQMKPEVLEVELKRRLEKAESEQKAKEATDKLKEAEAKAKTEAAPAVAPVPVEPAKVKEQPAKVETRVDEMESFLATVKGAFAPIKAARAQLRETANITRAATFADAVASAWKQLTKGGDK